MKCTVYSCLLDNVKCDGECLWLKFQVIALCNIQLIRVDTILLQYFIYCTLSTRQQIFFLNLAEGLPSMLQICKQDYKLLRKLPVHKKMRRKRSAYMVISCAFLWRRKTKNKKQTFDRKPWSTNSLEKGMWI